MGTSTFLSKINATKWKINAISTILLAILMFLTGFTPSVIRACIMAELGILAKALNRRSDILNNLCIALFLTLIYNPYNIMSASVLLSYGGVFRNNIFRWHSRWIFK